MTEYVFGYTQRAYAGAGPVAIAEVGSVTAPVFAFTVLKTCNASPALHPAHCHDDTARQPHRGRGLVHAQEQDLAVVEVKFVSPLQSFENWGHGLPPHGHPERAGWTDTVLAAANRESSRHVWRSGSIMSVAPAMIREIARGVAA